MPLLYSITFIDPDDSSGTASLSLFDFNNEAQFRTNITLTKESNPSLFTKYFDSLKKIINDENTVPWNFKDFIDSTSKTNSN